MSSYHPRTAEEIARALGGRRSGKGWIARCVAHDDHTPSLSLRDADDGRVLVTCHAGWAQDAVIAALRERGLWPERPHQLERTPAERRAWARQRAADERDLPPARWFARAAAMLAEEVLEVLDLAHPQRKALTGLLRALRSDAGALAEFRASGPTRKFTRALVAAGRESDYRAQRWLMTVLEDHGDETGA